MKNSCVKIIWEFLNVTCFHMSLEIRHEACRVIIRPGKSHGLSISTVWRWAAWQSWDLCSWPLNVTPSLLSPWCTFFFFLSHLIPPLRSAIPLCRAFCPHGSFSYASTVQSTGKSQEKTWPTVWRELSSHIIQPWKIFVVFYCRTATPLHCFRLSIILHSGASLFQLFGGQRDRGTEWAISVFPGISASCRQPGSAWLSGDGVAMGWRRLPFLQEQTQGPTNRLVSDSKHSCVPRHRLKRWQVPSLVVKQEEVVQRALLLTQQIFKTALLTVTVSLIAGSVHLSKDIFRFRRIWWAPQALY